MYRTNLPSQSASLQLCPFIWKTMRWLKQTRELLPQALWQESQTSLCWGGWVGRYSCYAPLACRLCSPPVVPAKSSADISVMEAALLPQRSYLEWRNWEESSISPYGWSQCICVTSNWLWEVICFQCLPVMHDYLIHHCWCWADDSSDVKQWLWHIVTVAYRLVGSVVVFFNHMEVEQGGSAYAETELMLKRDAFLQPSLPQGRKHPVTRPNTLLVALRTYMYMYVTS